MSCPLGSGHQSCPNGYSVTTYRLLMCIMKRVVPNRTKDMVSNMLIGTAAYASTVLVAGRRPQAIHGASLGTLQGEGYPTWRFLVLDDGWCRLRLDGHQVTLRAPQVLLLRPGVAYGQLSFGRHAGGAQCSFSVRAGQHGAATWTKALREAHVTEPDGLATWGVEPPEIIPAGQRSSIRARLIRLAACWWRDQAARLLTETSEQVCCIAELCGWRNQSAFGRAFRLAYGMSPGRWRRQHGVADPDAGG